MKKTLIWIEFAAFTLAALFFGGCDYAPLTEPDARKLAQLKFEHICKVFPYRSNGQEIYFLTNDFNPPQVITLEGGYSYTWTHKATNIEIHVGVSKLGEIGAGHPF